MNRADALALWNSELRVVFNYYPGAARVIWLYPGGKQWKLKVLMRSNRFYKIIKKSKTSGISP